MLQHGQVTPYMKQLKSIVQNMMKTYLMSPTQTLVSIEEKSESKLSSGLFHTVCYCSIHHETESKNTTKSYGVIFYADLNFAEQVQRVVLPCFLQLRAISKTKLLILKSGEIWKCIFWEILVTIEIKCKGVIESWFSRLLLWERVHVHDHRY